MTTRGNPSISPPVQISQPRHVPAISGTPPPNQQIYSSGQPPPISQGHFDYFPNHQQQGQALLPYQAYGSAPNDLRTNSAPGGRGGVPPPTSHFYQANQTMRPPQPPQGQFYVNPQAQGGLRHRQQAAAPNQAILMLPQHNNMVISSMYQPTPRLPMYSGNPSYPPYANPTSQMVYFPPNSVPRPQIPMQPANVATPRQREKRIITISDPNTGRNITDDVLKNPAITEPHQEETNVTDKGLEIRKDFTRQVAERMKSLDSSTSQPPMDSQMLSANLQPGQPKLVPQAYPQQQHAPSQPQAPVPVPVVSSASSMGRPQMAGGQLPPPMMGGPPHMNPRPPLMQQRPVPSQTPPGGQPRMPMVNLTRPPPQLPNAFFENRPQQNQQHPPLSQMAPVVQGPPQPLLPQTPPQSQPVHVEAAAPPKPAAAASVAATAAEAVAVKEPKPVAEPSGHSQPVSNIPSRPTPTAPVVEPAGQPPQPVVESTSQRAKEPAVVSEPPEVDTPVPLPAEKVSDTKEVPIKAEAAPAPAATTPPAPAPAEVSPPPTPIMPAPQSQQSPASTQDEPKEGPVSGASTQGSSKDVRKGKKSKKDLSRRDITGSDMDAFIDAATCELNGSGAKSPPTTTGTESPSQEQQDQNNQSMISKQRQLNGGATAAPSAVLKVEVDLEDSTSQETSPVDGVKTPDLNGEKASQVDSKKNKKKKKKKGKRGSQTAALRDKPSGQEEEAAAVVVNGTGTQPKEAAKAEALEINGNMKRRDSVESSPSVASMEAQPDNQAVVPPPQDSNVSEATQSKTVAEAASPATPAEVTPQPEPAAVEKQAAKPPAPETTALQEKPAPQKPDTPEKLAPKKASVSEESTPPKEVAEKSTPQSADAVESTPVKESVSSPNSQPDTDKGKSKAPVENQERLDNGEPGEVPPVDTPDKAKPVIKENHREVNDENEPPKDTRKSRGEKTADESAKDTETGSRLRKDAKDSKLQYDRAYLMELRECLSSQTKPDGLPDLDIILDTPVVSAPRMSGSAPLDFTPSFFQPTQGGQRHAPPIGKSSSRGRQRPGEVMPPQRIIKSVSIQNDIKPLHQTEKPWKPSKNDEAADSKRSLEAEVLFIMNRLTPTNFERLADEMKKLNIANYDDLTEVVKIFFEKATMETKFVEAYAELCKIMAPFRVPPPPNMKENQASFRVVMLTKCQQEFESDKTVIFEDPEEKKKKIEAEDPETPERAEKIESALYQLRLRRMRFYGNIRFIGELFKLGLLTEKIMHDCIFRLLKARDDDSLLSLCQLLTTVGKDLDSEKAKQRMDQYFTQMSKIAEERKSRIKFTLMDVLELRHNHWVPRKEAAVPKKIQDVHKDFAQEQARAQFLQSQPLPPRNDSQQPGSRRGSRQRQDDKTDDGWNTVGSKSIRMIDASKMKISKNIVDDNIQLGPGGGMKTQPMWSRGSHGGAQQSQDDKPAAANRFSALRNDEDRRPFQRSPSRGDGGPASRGMRQGSTVGHGRGKIISRSSTEGERRDAIANARSIMGGRRSQTSSRDNSWNRDDRRAYGPRSSGERDDMSQISLRPNEFRAPAPPVIKKAPDLSQDEMESKAKNILEEYLNIRDLAEAKLCIQELAGQPLMHVLVSSSMNDVLEQTDQARWDTGQYFHELMQSKLISADHYLKGLLEVLEFAEDMIIDIPKLWQCLAQLITPVILGGIVSLGQVKSSIKTHLANRSGAILMSNIIGMLAEKAGEAKVTREASALGWEDFKLDNVEAFLKERKIDFITKPPSNLGPPPPSSSSSASSQGGNLEQLTLDLENLIRNSASSSELIAYLEQSPPSLNKEKTIARALMTAIASSSRSKWETADSMEEVIKGHKSVLQKFVTLSTDLQLQALYAIQALMTQLQHPSGIIDMFFTTLFDEDVIDTEAFNKWMESNDPQEQAGKGASIMQLNQFFKFLKEESSEAS